MSGECYAFQRGECQRGDSCRFSHGGAGGGEGYAPRGNKAPCYAFQRGECERGASCRFSHDSEGGGGGFSNYSAPRSRSTGSGTCYAFQRGECTRGESCRFSHDVEGGGAGGDTWGNAGGDWSRGGAASYSSRPARSSGGTGVCYAFQRGECERGASCRFSHENGGGGGGGGGGSKGVCYAFQRGECERGESCRFSHVASEGF